MLLISNCLPIIYYLYSILKSTVKSTTSTAEAHAWDRAYSSGSKLPWSAQFTDMILQRIIIITPLGSRHPTPWLMFRSPLYIFVQTMS